ncbi:unnamed protein product [Camellia sinensis]
MELPLHMAGFGVLHRNEASGALSGLTISAIKDEVRSVLEFINYTYEIFGFTYDLKLSTLQQMSDDPMNQVSQGDK